MNAPPLSCAAARHEVDGWKVTVSRDGLPPLVLEPDEARLLSRDLAEMAELCDGKWGE